MEDTKAELAKQVAHLSYAQIKHRAQLQEALCSPKVDLREFEEIVQAYMTVLFKLKRFQDELSQMESAEPATAKPSH